MSSSGSINSAFVNWHDASFDIRSEQEIRTKSDIELPSPPITRPSQTSTSRCPLDLDYLFDGDRAKSDCMMRYIREDLSKRHQRGSRSNQEVSTIISAGGGSCLNEPDRSSPGRKDSYDDANDAGADAKSTRSSKSVDKPDNGGRGTGRTFRRRPAFGK